LVFSVDDLAPKGAATSIFFGWLAGGDLRVKEDLIEGALPFVLFLGVFMKAGNGESSEFTFSRFF
jgi:hypothetical protein